MLGRRAAFRLGAQNLGLRPPCAQFPLLRLARPISSSPLLRNNDPLLSKSSPPPNHVHSAVDLCPQVGHYTGPLTGTFKRLKIFSVASLGLSTTLAPFMFLIESNLPYSARLALALTAMATSGVSTALISWIGGPYVVRMRKLTPEEGGSNALEAVTLDMFLRERFTHIYDPDFLVDTQRPLAKWELAQEVFLPDGQTPTPGTEETVAQTMDKDGNVQGSWVVRWEENGEGKCRAIGKPCRYFSVHLELMSGLSNSPEAAPSKS